MRCSRSKRSKRGPRLRHERSHVPGHWGGSMSSGSPGSRVLDRESTGYWEKRGWHGTGPVNTVAKLWGVNRLGDGRIQVGGHAYAGTRGIKTVEVSTDGGDNWTEAALSPQLSGVDVWRQWKYEWRPSTEVSTVVVRAVDGLGIASPERCHNRIRTVRPAGVSKTIRRWVHRTAYRTVSE